MMQNILDEPGGEKRGRAHITRCFQYKIKFTIKPNEIKSNITSRQKLYASKNKQAQKRKKKNSKQRAAHKTKQNKTKQNNHNKQEKKEGTETKPVKQIKTKENNAWNNKKTALEAQCKWHQNEQR